MIITLKGADFSNSNIGTLSTWLINKSLKGDLYDMLNVNAPGFDI